MKHVLLCVLISALTLLSYAQHVVPDSSFGSNGIMTDMDDSVRMYEMRMALQPDGKMVLAGSYFRYLDAQSFDLVWELCLMRLTPEGRRDSSFNKTGMFRRQLEYGTRMADLVLQPDGKLLIALNNGTLMRFLPSGLADSSFSDTGQLKLPFLLTYNAVNALALQPDGKLLLTGIVYDSYMLIARLHPDGRMDDSFGFHGVVNLAVDSVRYLFGKDVVVQEDGKIILTGGAVALGGGSSNMIAVRLMPDGYLDGSFNDGKGYTKITFPEMYGVSGHRILFTQDSGILIAGTGFNQVSRFANYFISCFAKLTASGKPDSSFNGSGRAVVDSSFFPNAFRFFPLPAVCLQEDGKILMGMMHGAELYNKHFLLRCFHADGSPDTHFGTDGRVVTALSSENDYPWDIAILPDKKILLSGVAGWDTAWPQSRHAAPSVVRYKRLPEIVTPPGDTGRDDVIQIYPNPVQVDFLKLRYRLAEATEISTQLWNMAGRMICQWNLKAGASQTTREALLPLPEAMPAGCYLLRLSGGRMQWSSIIVKQ